MLAFGTSSAAGQLRITEILAANDGWLRDEDGESPGWIEVFNSGTNTVNLGGWHLTDHSENLTQWTFPATNLPAFSYLVVFASGKNRAVPGAPLHTGFRLDEKGEYLALVEPDGTTVAQEFSPAFPAQRFNVSYGLEFPSSVTALVATGASARVLVPSNGTLGLAWTARGFNDDSWLMTNTPVGFAVGTVPTPLLALDVNDRQNTTGTTEPGFVSFIINSNVSPSAIQTQATTRVHGSITVTVSNTAPYGYDDRLRTTPTNNGAFTESLLLRDFIFSRDDTGTGGLDVTLSGLAPNLAHRFTIWSFDTSSTGNRVSDWWANGVPMISNYSFSGANLPSSNGQYRFSFDTSSDNAGRILVSGRRDPASATFGVFLNALRVDTLTAVPATNGLAALMLSNNATAYLRIPFTVGDPDVFQALRLRMRYNDGFLAYLNGQLVASRHAPGSPQWNSTATLARSDVESLVPEEINLPNPPGLLVSGTNVLAIHGLNVSATDATFAIDPELDGIVTGTAVTRYFTPPSPGTNNGSGHLGLVADTKFSVDRGFYGSPFTVAITSATAGASIYWTTNGSVPSPTNGTLYSSPVAVAKTTLLRAAAFLTNHVPSLKDAHTYLFLNEVLQQPSSLPGYPTVWQASYPADYEMDPNIVNHPNYGATISNDLRTIPTLSLVSDHDAFWHPTTGIYVDATRSGIGWERPASVELFNGDNTSEFQIVCAVQMQGNASRDNVRLAKHSFRLQFKSEYGPSKLDYDWFGGGVRRFDNIVLRACFTDSWATRYSDQTLITGGKGTRYRPEDSLYLRDIWVKTSLRDMGHLSGRGDFVHLYVNGLYWGLYNPTERLDASFFSSHVGGMESDWDVIRDFTELLEGNPDDWNAMMALVNAGVTSESAYQAVAQLVDLENLADYILLHLLGEAEDWPHHNWYAAHRRANAVTGLPATRWIFLPWDQEIVLDQLVSRNRVDVSNDNTPARIYSQLRAWPEFRRLFGDRVQKHLFNGGALTASNNIVRMQGLAARIDRAIVGESARWGDAREFTIGQNPGHGQTFTRDEWWLPELQKLYTNFLPALNELTLGRLRTANLYPSVAPPLFSQFGGAVSNGFALVLSHTNGVGGIFYTLEGSDPREYGTGAVAAAARAYESPIAFKGATPVRARVLSGGNWSALVEAVFYPPQDLSGLQLTEIMYHPPDLGAINGNDLEFLELKNAGTNALDLSGLTFTSGITFTFTNGTVLDPGQFLVLARNSTALATKYPGVGVQGIFSGQLDNAGELLTLSHALGATVFSVSYDDQLPWPVLPDIADFSLVPRDPGVSQAPEAGSSWRASAYPGGSPGADDPSPTIPAVVLNEILSHTDPPQLDAVELFNPTASAVNLGGWFLSDDPGLPKKFRIPENTLLAAGGRAVFDENDFNPSPGAGDSFALDSTGDQVHLFSATTEGELLGYSHGVDFGAAFNGVSLGRFVNSAGEAFYPIQTAASLGETNAGPRIGPVVINEIHYHPEAAGDEFVELFNFTNSPVRLFDVNHPTNAWRLRGLSYDFPTNLTLPANALLLLVATNPAHFRVKYGVPTEVLILGPYAGQLQNSGENLELQAPDNPNTNGVVPYVAIEAVRYNDQSPWPPAADGGGPSLQRLQASAFGNEPLNWIAAAPSPGRFNVAGDSDGDGLPDAWEQVHGTYVHVPDANDDPDGDGLANWQEFMAGTHPNDAASQLKLSVHVTASGIELEFLAISNRTYTILQRLVADSGSWTALSNFPAHGTNRLSKASVEPLPGERQFYRLVTPAQP
jgi:hypothetical protein